MIIRPDEVFTAREAAAEIGKSSKTVRRYLEQGLLKGSNRAGRWQTTALDIWRFKGIADEMLENWRRYCLDLAVREADGDVPAKSIENNALQDRGRK